jgi:hypothetical protein
MLRLNVCRSTSSIIKKKFVERVGVQLAFLSMHAEHMEWKSTARAMPMGGWVLL